MQRSHIFFDEDVKRKGREAAHQTLFPGSGKLTNETVKSITKSYKILNDTIARSRNLDKVSKHLELQRNLHSKGRKKKVKTKNGGTEFVWYPKRKK